jgi:hypothetical protein
MRRPSKSRSVDPDRHYQLPHPDLVCVPPALIEDTRVNLSRYITHWEDLGVLAGKLARNLRDLEASGGCPEDLAQALSWAVSKYLLSFREEEERGEGVGGEVCVVGVNTHTETEKGVNTHNAGVVKGEVQSAETTALLLYLGGIGYQGAEGDLERWGLERFQGAINYVRSLPATNIQDLARYTRFALIKGLNAKPSPSPVHKYKRGPYGHVVQT